MRESIFTDLLIFTVGLGLLSQDKTNKIIGNSFMYVALDNNKQRHSMV